MPPRQRHRLRYNTESDIYIHFRSSARIVRPRRSLFIPFSRHREIPHCRSSNSSMWGRGGSGGVLVIFSSLPPLFLNSLSFPLSPPHLLLWLKARPPNLSITPTPILIFHSLPGWDPVLAPTPPLTKTQPHVAMETTSSAPVGPCKQ